MNHVKNSLLAAGAVAAAATMVVAGSVARDRADLGGKRVTEAPLRNLVASRDNSSVPEGDYFYEIANLLKEEYVEPIKDESKLATGAVRGMVFSLGDPKSLFMDKEEFSAFLNRRQGIYEGIGVDLELKLPGGAKAVPTSVVMNDDAEVEAPSPGGSLKIPRLMVVNVVPGGPADRAGVKPGDVVDTIDGHWVLNSDLIQRFRKANRDWLAKKIPLDTLNKIRKEVREKAERNIMPLKAKERLSTGASGAVKVIWSRNGALRTTPLVRARTQAPAFIASGTTIRLPLTAGAAQKVREAIKGKSAITLDLTHNVNGDFGEMKAVLAELAPAGDYGTIANERGNKPQILRVEKGNPKSPKITVKVDSTTRGAAEILALALQSRGLATLSGSPTGGDRSVLEIVQLPDGSGYTLTTGEYKPNLKARRKS
jgi:carboxyl-terminal processing protease